MLRLESGLIQMLANTREGILDLLPKLYDAAAGNSTWQPIAGEIARVFNADSAALQIQNHRQGRVERLSQTGNYPSDWSRTYLDNQIYKLDLWVQRALRKAPGAVVGSDDLISDGEFARSECYRFYRQLGIFYVLGALLPLGSGDDFIVMGVHRNRRHGLFTRAQKQWVAPLLPHVQQALQLRARLIRAEVERAASFAALERAAIGVVAVTVTARIIFINVPAEQIISANPCFVARGGQLSVKDPREASDLQQRIRQAATTGIGTSLASGGTVRVTRPDARPLILSVYPFPSPVLAGTEKEPLALVFMADSQRLPSADVLAQIYRLTPAEARLARALVEGERLQDYADQAGISIYTAKTQLKSIFEKTGSERQSDLIRDVLGNPVTRMTKD